MAAIALMSDIANSLMAELAQWGITAAAMGKIVWNMSKARSDIDSNSMRITGLDTKIDKGREEDRAQMERDFQRQEEMLKEIRNDIKSLLIQRGA